MIRRPPRSTHCISSAASDVYKRQVKAQGMGGRQVRTGLDTGQIFDHHAVEYTYANGHRLLSHCRHQKGCWNSVAEYTHGTKGYANISKGEIFDNKGNSIFKSKEGPGQRGGHQQEHHDLFADLAAGKIPNEGEYGAKSTFAAIFGSCLLYTSPSPRDATLSRMPSSA